MKFGMHVHHFEVVIYGGCSKSLTALKRSDGAPLFFLRKICLKICFRYGHFSSWKKLVPAQIILKNWQMITLKW